MYKHQKTREIGFKLTTTDLSNFDKQSRSLERSCFSFIIAVTLVCGYNLIYRHCSKNNQVEHTLETRYYLAQR